MAVELDAAVSADPTVNQNSITWEHTIGAGDNRILLIVLASGSVNPIADTPAPTVNGNEATLLEFRTRDTTSGGTAWCLTCYFDLSAKTLATMSRPQGYSQSHWRKVYRTMKPIDITVSA